LTESFDLGSLTAEFREEARDQVDRLDAILLELEREGRVSDESRSSLLRTLHTLKGNAGMLGLTAIRDYVHSLENVLKGERSEWSEAAVERLFAGAAALRAAVEAAGTDAQEETFTRLLAERTRLEEIDLRAGSGTSVQSSVGKADLESGVGEFVRVPFSKLDGLLNQVGELLGEAVNLDRRMRGREPGSELAERADSIRRRVDGVRETVMSLRLVPMGRVLNRFHSLVRRLAREQGKEARLVLEGEATETDKSTADALAEPLLHLVRNAIDHGIEPPAEREAAGRPRHGTVTISAARDGDRLRITVEDDGAGLQVEEIRARGRKRGHSEMGVASESEVIDLIFEPGFSTRLDVSTVSGQGVGLDVVRRTIRALRGDLGVERPAGGGTRFIMRLPLSVAIVPSLVFEASGEMLAIPTSHVARTLRLDDVDRVGRMEVVREEDTVVPLAETDRLFGWPSGTRGEFGVLIRHGGQGVVVPASRLVDQRELVVKSMPVFGRRVRGVSGGSVLPGGKVILVLDPGEVIELSAERWAGGDGAGAS
jgi:two-component system chemotaxis sensor kinase CheA